MSKTRANFTVDDDIFQQFKLEVENMSSEIQRFMKARVNGNWDNENDKDIQEKIQEYERKLEQIEKQKEEILEKEAEFETRISSLKAQKEQNKKQEQKEQEGWIEVNQEVDA